MPNVRGLDPAPTIVTALKPGTERAYGPHCYARLDAAGTAVSLHLNGSGATLTSVHFPAGGKPKIITNLASIDATTSKAVNRFLLPYGNVEVDWRLRRDTGEIKYVWRANGATRAAAAPAPVAAPKPAPVTPPSAPETVLIRVTGPYAKRGTGVSIEETVPEPTADEVAESAATLGAHATTVIPAVAGTVIETEIVWTGKRLPEVRAITKNYSRIGGVLAQSADARTLERAWRKRQAGRPSHVLITGPAGTAKTRVAREFAFTKGVPYIHVSGVVQTADDWYGGFVPKGEGGFDWVWYDFALALMRGTPCVILIDEINRAENERALNGLMNLLDHVAMVKTPGMPHKLILPPGILIIATLNEGPEYVATVQIDKAVRDRFSEAVWMDYSPNNIEERVIAEAVPGLDKTIIKRLVRIAQAQRKQSVDGSLFPSGATISPRNLIEIAAGIAMGDDPKECIWGNLKGAFWKEDVVALTNLIEAQFGSDAPVDLDDDLPGDEELEALLDAVDGL